MEMDSKLNWPIDKQIDVGSNIQIVTLTPEHATAYLALRKMSEIELPQYVGPNAERELLSGPEGIAPLMAGYAAEGTLVFGAVHAGVLISVLAVSRRLSPKFKHRALIWGMYVAGEYRHLKVGTQLLTHVQHWAQQHPEVTILWLHVTASNTPAISFYEKQGFAIYGTEPDSLFTQGEYHAAHYMQKKP